MEPEGHGPGAPSPALRESGSLGLLVAVPRGWALTQAGKLPAGSELLQKDGRPWGEDMSPRKYVGAESAILWAILIVPKESGVSCGQ